LSRRKKELNDNEIPTYQDVIRLDVPVDESHLVDTVHGTHQLRDVEPEKARVSSFYDCGRKRCGDGEWETRLTARGLPGRCQT